MNILVTGAGGQLGSCIRDIASGKEDHYIFTDVADLDITDRDAVVRMICDNKVDVVVNCAAYTDVEKAEDNIGSATLINADAVANLAEAVNENGGMLMHVSTDYVFGGNANNTPCTEQQQPNPTGVYGFTKLEGERRIAESGCRAIIFRTSWMYSEYGKNFVKTMLSLLSTKDVVKVVFDQTGTPTYARDLATTIVDIITRRSFQEKEGVYHYSNEGVCSWFDFAKSIAEYSGISSCEILPCHSSEFPSKVHRPAYSVLDKTKFKETFGITVPYWRDSLRRCITNLRKNEA